MTKRNSSSAYLLWCLCLFGICGLQRFYAGQFWMGCLYLFTFGFFGLGQLLDLVLIPGLVRRRNAELRRLQGFDQTVPDPLPLRVEAPAASPMQQLLQAAQKSNGRLSKAQAALSTGLAPHALDQLLYEALRAGYADVTNDPETGAVRYHFDI
ncbi:MAG: TM2 domain-containing protein [Nodosilinea sp.]